LTQIIDVDGVLTLSDNYKNYFVVVTTSGQVNFIKEGVNESFFTTDSWIHSHKVCDDFLIISKDNQNLLVYSISDLQLKLMHELDSGHSYEIVSIDCKIERSELTIITFSYNKRYFLIKNFTEYFGYTFSIEIRESCHRFKDQAILIGSEI
jgi:hypothetical protein